MRKKTLNETELVGVNLSTEYDGPERMAGGVLGIKIGADIAKRYYIAAREVCRDVGEILTYWALDPCVGRLLSNSYIPQVGG